MLELNEDSLTPEHLDNQVQKAQEQLIALKRQQDQIEKQKRELEELSRRQEELEKGRAEMSDKLARSLVILEREAYDSQKKLEQIRATRESFGQHLELIEAIDPKSWNPAELHKELSRALSTVWYHFCSGSRLAVRNTKWANRDGETGVLSSGRRTLSA